MLLYSLIMFFTAAIFGIISVSIYKGNTNLINAYHQTKVTDKASYGKAFGKALFVMAVAMLISGIAALFEDFALIAVIVLMIGLVIGVTCIVAVQKKYNKGIF